MSYFSNVTAVSAVNFGRAHDVCKEGKMIADRYIGGEASAILAGLFHEMVGMPHFSHALSKTPVVGGREAFQATCVSTPVVAGEIGPLTRT